MGGHVNTYAAAQLNNYGVYLFEDVRLLPFDSTCLVPGYSANKSTTVGALPNASLPTLYYAAH